MDLRDVIRETSARDWLERAKTADIDHVSMSLETTGTTTRHPDPGPRGRARRRGSWCAALLMPVGVLLAGVAAAGDGDERIVRRLGFEERATTDWSHVFEQAPGLPRRGLFFDAVVDESVRHRGQSSLRLELEGGSISYRMLPEAAIPLESDADYRISGWIRTEGLENAQARLELRIVDGDRMKLIKDTSESKDPVAEATVELLVGRPGPIRDGWMQTIIEIDTGRARYAEVRDPRLFLSLQVVQPGFDREDELLGGRVARVRVEDVGGRAWFDDLQVSRTPRLRLVNREPGGFHRDGRPVVMSAIVDDPFQDLIPAIFEVRDLDGTVVERRRIEVEADRRFELEFTPRNPGWFEADLKIEGGGPNDRQTVRMIVLSDTPDTRSNDVPRLGVSLSGWTPETLGALEESLEHFDPGVIEFPIWPVDTDDRPSLEGLEPLRSTLDRQRFANREVMLAIDRLHGGLAGLARVEPEAVRAALTDDGQDIWRHAIKDWMLRLGTSISRWRIAGGPAPSPAPDLLQELADEYVADPLLLLSRPVESNGTWGGDEHYVISDQWFSSRSFQAITDGLLEGATVRLEPPPMNWRPRDRVDEAARRIIEAWASGAQRILAPWRQERGPDASMLAWTGLSPILGGRRPSGEIPIGATSRCLIANDERGPVLVLFSDQVDRPEMIRIPVGDRTIEVRDLDGRIERITPVDGLATVRVTSTPRAILKAEPLPVSIAGSVEFKPGRVSTGREEHPLEVIFRNPTGRAIEGRIRLSPPRGWTFEPAAPAFDVEAFGRARVPVILRWSGPPALGRHVIRGEVDFADGSNARVPVSLELEVDSSQLRLDADWDLARSEDPRQAPIIVAVTLENIGTRIMDVEITTSAWRIGRERRILTGLLPGERRVRLMHLKAGLDRLAGTDVGIQVREIDGPEGVSVRLPIFGGAGIGDGGEATAVVEP